MLHTSFTGHRGNVSQHPTMDPYLPADLAARWKVLEMPCVVFTVFGGFAVQLTASSRFKHFKVLSMQPRTTADARSEAQRESEALVRDKVYENVTYFTCTDESTSDCFWGVLSSAVGYNLPITNSCRAALWLAAPEADGSQWAHVVKTHSQCRESSHVRLLNGAAGKAGENTTTQTVGRTARYREDECEVFFFSVYIFNAKL